MPEQKLRIWHIPQVPMKSFNVEVSSIEEAWRILNILWDYDDFQYKNEIKPDYASVSGLQYYDEEEKEWYDWEDDDGYDIVEHFRNMESEQTDE